MSRKWIFDWECQHERVESFLWGLLAECACHISCCSSNSLLSHTTSTSVSISRDLFPSLQLWQKLSFALMFWLLVHLAALIGVWALMPVATCQWFSSHIPPFCTSSIQQEPPPPCLFPFLSVPSWWPDICIVICIRLPSVAQLFTWMEMTSNRWQVDAQKHTFSQVYLKRRCLCFAERTQTWIIKKFWQIGRSLTSSLSWSWLIIPAKRWRRLNTSAWIEWAFRHLTYCVVKTVVPSRPLVFSTESAPKHWG